jgi:hypothetical protein
MIEESGPGMKVLLMDKETVKEATSIKDRKPRIQTKSSNIISLL